MPQLIRHIDAIAREKQRDVLFVIFHKTLADDIDWAELPIRKFIIDWLDEKNIKWECCGHYANTNLICGYRGQIYIDMPFDESDPGYQQLRNFLELPDGTMRFEGMKFCYDTLVHAMKNARHDEPGFWENWAENF